MIAYGRKKNIGSKIHPHNICVICAPFNQSVARERRKNKMANKIYMVKCMRCKKIYTLAVPYNGYYICDNCFAEENDFKSYTYEKELGDTYEEIE